MAGIELGKAYVQIVPSAEGISGSISQVLGGEAKSAGKSAGSTIGSALSTAVGTALGGAITAAAGGLTSAASGLLSSFGDVASYGDNIDKMSQKLGISAEAYQEWDAILQHSGTSIESMKAAFKGLNAAIESGGEAFEELGIDDYYTMNTEELFSAVITRLQEWDDEFDRAAIAQDIFGRSAQELGPLLNTSAEETQAMRDRVHDLGGVLSDDAVKASASFQDNLQDLGTAFQSIGRSMISDFLPSVSTAMNGLTEIIAGNTEEGKDMLVQGVTDFIHQIPDALKKTSEITMAFMSAAKEVIPELISTISTFLPDVAKEGAELLLSLVDGILDALPDLLNAALEIVMMLVTTLAENAPTILRTIVTVVSTLITNLASFISENGELLLMTVMDLLTSIILALPELIPELVDAAVILLDAVIDTLLDFLPEFFEASTDLTLALIDGLMDALPKLGSAAGKIMSTLLSAIIEHLPEILIAGVKLQIEFAAGLIKAIPKILSAVAETIFAILYEAQDYIENINWAELGMNIINGIKDGILGAASNLVNAVTDVGGQAVNGIKSFFGIASPSKLMREEIGKYIPEGLALGIEDEEDSVQNAMGLLGTGTLRGVSASLAMAGSGMTASNYAGANGPVQLVAPIYIGDRLLDTVVTEATNRYNFRTGGR